MAVAYTVKIIMVSIKCGTNRLPYVVECFFYYSISFVLLICDIIFIYIIYLFSIDLLNELNTVIMLYCKANCEQKHIYSSTTVTRVDVVVCIQTMGDFIMLHFISIGYTGPNKLSQ